MEILVYAAGDAMIAQTGEQMAADGEILNFNLRPKRNHGSDMANPGCGGGKALIVRTRLGKWD
jgi:hypothetical protein